MLRISLTPSELKGLGEADKTFHQEEFLKAGKQYLSIAHQAKKTKSQLAFASECYILAGHSFSKKNNVFDAVDAYYMAHECVVEAKAKRDTTEKILRSLDPHVVSLSPLRNIQQGLINILDYYLRNADALPMMAYEQAVMDWIKKFGSITQLEKLSASDRNDLFAHLKQTTLLASFARHMLLKSWQCSPNLIGELFSQQLLSDSPSRVEQIGRIIFRLFDATSSEKTAMEKMWGKSIEKIVASLHSQLGEVTGEKKEESQAVLAIHANEQIFAAINRPEKLLPFVRNDNLFALHCFYKASSNLKPATAIALCLKMLILSKNSERAEKNFQIPADKILQFQHFAFVELSRFANEGPEKEFAKKAIEIGNSSHVVTELFLDQGFLKTDLILAMRLDRYKAIYEIGVRGMYLPFMGQTFFSPVVVMPPVPVKIANLKP